MEIEETKLSSGKIGDNTEYQSIAILEEERVSNLKQLTQLELYWRRFRSNRLAIIGAVMLLLLVLSAIFAQFLVPRGVAADTTFNLGFNNPLNLTLPYGENGPTLDNFPVGLFGYSGPTYNDHSVWAMVMYGGRISLIIGVAASLLTSLIGTVVGAISGFFGGWVDNLMMRITDVFLTLPFLPLVITLSSIYTQGSGNVLLIIGVFALTGWPGLARLVRAQYLSLRELEYAEAARAVGVNQWRIIFRHLLPNTFAPIIVATTLGVAGTIIGESTLDYLGVGVQFPPTASWGNVLADSQNEIGAGNWWWVFFPGLFIVLTVLAINFVGDGLRDALDVRSRDVR